MRTKLFIISVCLVINFALAPATLSACSGQGPADPVTGLISYPPGTGNSEGTTTVPTAGLAGTPFEGGKYYKGWVDNAMKLLVVPAGTTLAFEGVIEGVAGGPRPAAWEEGAVKGIGGSTVEGAPLPTWTLSGNGRGDYRDGSFPPTVTGLKYVNFESPPSTIIAADTPNEKALWYLTYDRDTAVRVLVSVWNDPIARALFIEEASVPSDFDMDAIAAAAKEPQADDGAKGLNEFEISPTGSGGIQALKDGLDTRLSQRTGQIVQTGGMVTRKFKDAAEVEFTVNMEEAARIIVKAGYVAMQGAADMDFYPTGRYNTKYYITPPSTPQYEVGKSKLALNFSAPSAPDYWVIDLHSGLESARDCVWCWVEVDAELKAEGTKIVDQTDIKSFYTVKPNSYAVGGVFVRGLYQSGSSSVGRNTMVYVVVADTESPAQYRWESAEVTGETGKTLVAADKTAPFAGGAVKFRVFDNNPVIGANGEHNNIFSVFEDLNAFEYVESSKRPANQAANPEVYARYLEPVKDGFDEKNLLPTLHYNLCVPAYAGLKVPGEPRDYKGPLPILNDSIVLPLQRFVWKTADSAKTTISSRKIYDVSGNEVSDLASLHDQPSWKGYSSYLVTVESEGFTEPMGTGLADNSVNSTLSIAGDLQASAPTRKQLDAGIPVDQNKVHFFGWNNQALKMFVSASDGLTVRSSYPDGNVDITRSNRSPAFTGATSIQKILANKFSGAEIEYPAASPDFVSIFEEPATVDALAAKLKATEIVKGGSLGGCALPAGLLAPAGAWGKFNYVSQLTDTGRPNIALEVLNSKNEKAVIFGNLYAMGESPCLASAAFGAGTDDYAYTVDSNVGDKSYSSASTYYDDTAWEFKDDIDKDWYLPMKNGMDNGAFKPWLFAFDKAYKSTFWKTGYWNGEPVSDDNGPIYYDKKLAFQQGSRDRLVFRYWVYDNINPLDIAGAMPNGVRADSSPARTRFKNVSGFVNAEVKLIDKPGYQGAVAYDKVWWPDYIFHNPSGGSAEECSIALKAEDEKNNVRNLKLWFRIIPPSREIIRTIEDRRNREN